MKSFKSKFSCILAVLMLFQCFGSGIVFAGQQEQVQKINVQMFNGNTSQKSNSIYPWFKINNSGTKPVNLKEIKLRYYFTNDGDKPQNFWCDYSTIGASNVTGTFVKMAEGYSKADCYLEIGFNEAAGILYPGSEIQVQTRFAKSDWSNFDQTNDYSFNSTARNYADGDNFTAYIGDNIINGVEPKLPLELEVLDKYDGVLLNLRSAYEANSTYTVNRKTDNGVYSTIASDIKDSAYFDKTVEVNKTYTYFISKTDSKGKVINSNEVTIKHVIVDTDGDGLPDDFENIIGTDKTKSDTDGNAIMDGDEDADNDGLSNIEELKYGTNPLSADTDEDSMGDGVEVLNKLNPLEKDTDKNGIIDSEEVFEQSLLPSKYKDIDITKTLVKPDLKITGCGDYSKQISIKDASNSSKAFSVIHSLVGDAFEIVHNSDLKFQSANVSFKISEEVLKNHELKNLRVASYNTENNDLSILDTNIDETNNKISTAVNNLSCYCVIDIAEYKNDADVLDYKSNINMGKADVIIVVNTIDYTGVSTDKVKNKIKILVNYLKANEDNIMIDMYQNKDIIKYYISSGINNGMVINVDQLKKVLNLLGSRYGGGDNLKHILDGIDPTTIISFRSYANKYIITVSDASHEGDINAPNVTMDSEKLLFENDNISVSIKTNTYYKAWSDLLVEYISYNKIAEKINENYSAVIEMLVKKVQNIARQKIWIRLSNGEIVALAADPANGNKIVDTDGDGIADVDELGEEIEKSFYDSDLGVVRTYKCWTFKSNPAEK